MKKPSEAGFKRAVWSYLECCGLTPIRIHGGAMLGSYVKKDGKVSRWAVVHNKSGAPDLLVHVPPNGRGVAIECKAPKGRQSPAQVAWQAALEKVGVVYVVARILDDVQDAIRKARMDEGSRRDVGS